MQPLLDIRWNHLEVDAVRSSVSLISNVVYSQAESRGFPNVALRMDILKPKSRSATPAVLFIPGGAFLNANKDSFIQQRLDLAEAGYLVASMEYACTVSADAGIAPCPSHGKRPVNLLSGPRGGTWRRGLASAADNGYRRLVSRQASQIR